MIYITPFLNIIATSSVSTQEVVAKKSILFPATLSLGAYYYTLSTPTISRALVIPIGVTGVGTIVNMCATSLIAYGLSREYLFNRGFVSFLIVFSILFNGGMIPTFLVIHSLGLVNSYWVVILSVTVNAMNMIIMRNFFRALPNSLEEPARTDGCTDFGIFFKAMLPLALPSTATISLFCATTYWSTYITAILYINDPSKWPIQILLRQIVIVPSRMQAESSAIDVTPPVQTAKVTVIVIAIILMLIAYLSVQECFVKGTFVGSAEG